jgi:hypothetical protein
LLCRSDACFDASLAGVDGAFDLLEAYLKKLDAPSAHSVFFVGEMKIMKKS